MNPTLIATLLDDRCDAGIALPIGCGVVATPVDSESHGQTRSHDITGAGERVEDLPVGMNSPGSGDGLIVLGDLQLDRLDDGSQRLRVDRVAVDDGLVARQRNCRSNLLHQLLRGSRYFAAAERTQYDGDVGYRCLTQILERRPPGKECSQFSRCLPRKPLQRLRKVLFE